VYQTNAKDGVHQNGITIEESHFFGIFGQK
jgi:hypothetical protein